ncbi:HlyC/CorC family transporter [candidate division WOR-3 bacterium]|nr:HlyC/CorC family transporter [candidate division WOR-3 bacterium]
MTPFALLIPIGVLLVASAFFSSSETAYFSLSPVHASRIGKRHLAGRLLRSRDRLLATILTGNLLVNVTATALWTTFLILLSREFLFDEAQRTLVMSLGPLAMVVLLLVIGEITPKIIAVRLGVTLARVYAPVLVFFSWVFFPITWVLQKMFSPVLRKRPKERPFPTDEEVKTMIEMAVRYGILRPDEELIMENLVDLGERTVREVMTPRLEMKALEASTKRSEALAYARDAHRSRYPVYEETTDKVLGILYVKDLLISSRGTPIKGLLREPYFVPETKALSELLEELRRSDQHIAVVIDEFGGTSGLVTLEDILEAIFGEIVDEYDSTLPYRKLEDGSYLVKGTIDLATLNQLFDEAFTDAEEEFDRLSELLTHELGHIPVKGEKLNYNGIVLTVSKVRGMAIEQVHLVKKESE